MFTGMTVNRRQAAENVGGAGDQGGSVVADERVAARRHHGGDRSGDGHEGAAQADGVPGCAQGAAADGSFDDHCAAAESGVLWGSSASGVMLHLPGCLGVLQRFFRGVALVAGSCS